MVRVIQGGLELVEPATVELVPADTRTPVVASLNLSPEPGNIEGNLLLAERAITAAKQAHPALDWVVLPELFTSAYSGLAQIHQYAEPALEGESVRFFSRLARELGVHIAYGFPEQLPVGGVADSVNLIGPSSGPEEPGVLMTYRKRHLVRTTGEDMVFVPGAELPVIEAGGLRVALVVCWDLGFPEVVREAALAGAELILASAGWRDPWGAQYELSCAARALDNAVYLASANQIGVYPEASFGTAGGVYGPDGTLVSEGVDVSGGVLGIAEVDPGFPERWRGFYGDPVLERRNLSLEACS